MMSDATRTMRELAPAKINLALHLTGRRADGYHLLDSLVVFLDLADRLHATPNDDRALNLALTGQFSSGLESDERNFVIRAARLLQRHAGMRQGADLLLEKQVPMGAGLGGGSADAAAALRLLNRMWQCAASDADLEMLAQELGADVASCVRSQPVRMQGIGEILSPLPAMPESLHVLLAYPNAPLATPAVYQSGKAGFSGALPVIPAQKEEWPAAILQGRNDLYLAAASLSELVVALIAALESLPDSLAVRMSGSGSACFAVFDDARAAALAFDHLSRKQPSLWVRLCRPISGF